MHRNIWTYEHSGGIVRPAELDEFLHHQYDRVGDTVLHTENISGSLITDEFTAVRRADGKMVRLAVEVDTHDRRTRVYESDVRG